jgi:UDP-N-acetyl-D-glucosamine dehydrogenase
MYKELMSKIENGTAVAGIIGLGYVGLPLAQHLVGRFRVLAFDIDPAKIDILRRGDCYIKHLDSTWIGECMAKNRFEPTCDFSRLAEADCISICVPTPLDRNGVPDLAYVRETTKNIAKHLRPGQLVILESTSYPGTTRELCLPLLAASGLQVGRDFFLAFSPEREDPGNAKFTISAIPKVVGGMTPECTGLVAAYYGRIFKQIVKVSSPAAAELSKLLENIFRSVNIALVNELKMLCHRMDIDIWEVIDAAATKPFGYMPFYPGPGLGGHCIPIDPFYLSWKAREYEFQTKFIELAGEINTAMPHFVVQCLMEEFNRRGITLNGARILVLGVAYKRDVDDTRESPSLKLIELLQKSGASVDYNDPYVPAIPKTRRYDLQLVSVELTAESLSKYDCVMIVTDHHAYDYEYIVRNAQLVLDTRNATRNVTQGREKIVKA